MSDVVEGAECTPDNISAQEAAQAEADQLVCQLTWEEKEVLMPGRYANARRGDVILSPGGTGLIGLLLRRVDPAQQYSHSGIMTRNYDEVTHSTASEERLLDNLVGSADGSDGVHPRALKYMWPGVVAQSVEAAIHGEQFPAPEKEQFSDPPYVDFPPELQEELKEHPAYSISSFEPHKLGASFDGQFEIVPPLVVKPDPILETVEIRQALHVVAEKARSMAGRPNTPSKSHYRLYCYTNPGIGMTDDAPADAGWATGTFGSVCSSFIWHMHQLTKTHLEGPNPLVTQADLEESDKEQGAEVTPSTMDGLYKYTAAERLAAGEWLYDKVYNMAYDDAGWFGVFLTDGADDTANQLLNAFAHDEDDGKDSEAWRETGDANAVSPDNLVWWDGPDRGGLYGFPEPLQYREPRREKYQVSRWTKVLTRGTLRGRIVKDGQPVAGAVVEIQDQFDWGSDTSEADGSFELTNVPLGPYPFKAWRDIEEVSDTSSEWIHYSTAFPVTLEQEDQDMGDIPLKPPADKFRLAQIDVAFWGSDYEPFDDNEILQELGHFELDVSPDKLSNSRELEYKWGAELRVVYHIVVQWLEGNAIQVSIWSLLYEGTTEDTEDLDGIGEVVTFVVSPGEAMGTVVTVKNTGEDEEDDRGELTITVVNAQNTV
jgi:hypothetical protein